MSQPLTLHCGEDDCNLPWARIQNGCLIVVSRHRGELHTNVIPIDKLYEMCYNDEHKPLLPPVDPAKVVHGM